MNLLILCASLSSFKPLQLFADAADARPPFIHRFLSVSNNFCINSFVMNLKIISWTCWDCSNSQSVLGYLLFLLTYKL